MSELTLESLQAQIKELSEVVTKQKQIIAKTGQQLLELQLKQTQDQLKNINIPKANKNGDDSDSNSVDMSDYVTNEDLVQLVGELQGQLILVEQRSLRRTFNSTLDKDTDRLAPLLNSDGEEPPAEDWPETVKDFKELSDENLLKLSLFFELLPPTDQEAAIMNSILDTKIAIANGNLDAEKEVDDPALETKNYPKEALEDFYDDLARFVGVKTRKTGGWQI